MRSFFIPVCLLFIALSLVPFANAQESSGYGLWGGAGINNFKGDDFFGNDPGFKDKMKIGPVAGIAIFPPVPSKVVLFQVDIYYALKGDQWVKPTDDEITYSLHYLGADAMLRLVIPVTKFLRPYLAGGGYGEVMVSGVYNIDNAAGGSDSGSIEDLPATTVAFADFGIAAEGGLQFRIGKKELFVSSRYSLGLFKVLGDDTNPTISWLDIKNRGLSFSAGYMSLFEVRGKKGPAEEPEPVTPIEPGAPGGGV